MDLQPKISKASLRFPYRQHRAITLHSMFSSSWWNTPHNFWPAHPANTCPDQSTGDGKYYDHYWHRTHGKAFCGNFVWCWNLFSRRTIFCFALPCFFLRQNQKLLGSEIFLSNNQMLPSSHIHAPPQFKSSPDFLTSHSRTIISGVLAFPWDRRKTRQRNKERKRRHCWKFCSFTEGSSNIVHSLSTINARSELKKAAQTTWLPHNHGEGWLLTKHLESGPKHQDSERCLSQQAASCCVLLDSYPSELGLAVLPSQRELWVSTVFIYNCCTLPILMKSFTLPA